MISSILRGKTREEITKDFLYKHHINMDEWNKYNKEMKKLKIPEFSKHTVLLWAVPILIFGLTLLISLLASASLFDDINTFPRIFKVEDPTFFQRMVNVGEGLFLVAVGLLLIIFPFKAISKTYDW